jgi:transposase
LRPDVKAAREVWRAEQPLMDVARLVFIDETGISTKMTRLYGWALRKMRCLDHCPFGHWHTNTFIAALRVDRVDAPILFDGPMNGPTFLAYIRDSLGPALKSGDIVICDNLASHKVEGVKEAVEARGAQIRYLPPYSPDLNPIEMFFSILKTNLRRCAPRTCSSIIEAIKDSILTVSSSVCQRLFRHACYAAI